MGIKISREKSNRLIVEHRPFLVWAFCFVWFTIGVGTIASSTVFQKNHLFDQVVGWPSLIFSVLFTFYSPWMRIAVWDFDTFLKKLTVKHSFLWAETTLEYSFSDINQVQLDTGWDQPLYGIKISLSNNESLYLCLYHSLFYDAAVNGVICISNFLNIPSDQKG